MAKKKIGNSCVQIISVGILIFIIFIALLMFTPIGGNLNRRSSQAPEKACYANMRVILGAVEMYNMDHEKMMESLDEDELIREKYLRSKPPKPEPGCEYYSFGNLASDSGFVCCTVHGTVEDSSETKIPAPPPGPPPEPPSIWDKMLNFFKRF